MGGPVYFGIRHLSPAGAVFVRQALEKHAPRLILVEGPSDLSGQMHWLCHSDTRLPAAILAYSKELPIKTLLIPLAEYSPEYQAILWAREHGVQCRFMDLPSGVFLAMPREEPVQDSPEDDFPGNAAAESVYERLEALTGEDLDTFWERSFEQVQTMAEYQNAAQEFGRQLREAAQDSPRRQAENLVREAYMKRVVQKAVDSGIPPEKIFCVCGAYHVQGLLETSPLTDEEEALLPRCECSATLMPYSYYRLSTRSGYGAGNRAPAYFHLLWETLRENTPETIAARYLTQLAAAHRQAGNPASSAQVIEAIRLALTLANLRGSRRPCLGDLRDAAITCMGEGQLSQLAVAVAQVEIGSAIGSLPQGVSRTSIQEDFYRQLKLLNLERFRSLQTQRLDLDLRERLNVKSQEAAFLDLNRSLFLHRLRVLGIHFATPVASRQESANWGEYWDLQWTPEMEIELVESALLGDTVEGAACFALKERAGGSSCMAEAAGIFRDAFYCRIPSVASYALQILQGLSVDAAAIGEIAATAQELSVVIRYGDLRRFNTAGLPDLLSQLFLRACLTLEDACICDAEASLSVMEAMQQLNIIQLSHDFLPEDRFLQLMERISDRDDLNTRCSGFAMAILLERGSVSEELLAREVSRRLSRGVPADLGAGWFEGLARKNRYSLITRLSLWRQLSDYLDTLEDMEFRRALVFLRRAFSDFTPAQKSDVAENLGEIWGVNSQQAAELLLQEPTQQETQLLEGLDDFDFTDI